jgi:hypothetical protein
MYGIIICCIAVRTVGRVDEIKFRIQWLLAKTRPRPPDPLLVLVNTSLTVSV